MKNKHLSFLNLSEEDQLKTVKILGTAIDLMGKTSYKVKMAAVRQNGMSIQYIYYPSEELQIEAVKECPASIKHIRNPSHRVQFEAVKKDPESLIYINNPDDTIRDLACDLIRIRKNHKIKINEKYKAILS